MKYDFSNYVRHCILCHATKPKQKRPAGLMGANRLVSLTFVRIAAGIIGSLGSLNTVL